MKIEIDATPLLLVSAGVKNYFYYWLKHLRRQAAKDEKILAFPFIGKFGDLTHERSVLPFWATYPRLAMLYGVNILGYPFAEWITSRADVFHTSNQVRNPPRKTLLTATVHDMTCWLMPELHTAANVRADKSYAERVLSRAAGLIAVSENTKQDLVRLAGISEENIEVIHPGIPEQFFHVPAEEVWRVREAYNLPHPYLLNIGTVEPRKNLDTLLDAYGQLSADIRQANDLVIAGPGGWSAEATLARLHAGEHDVRYLGYIPEADLPALTAGARAFVYPSLYEGFGFPVAQAIACGVPVVVSNVSSLPEVAGDGGLQVDPRSVSELGAALERIIENQELREILGAKGKQRAESFRWEQCARRSLLFFRNVAGRL